jgi:hypothetical protein
MIAVLAPLAAPSAVSEPKTAIMVLGAPEMIASF